MNERQPDAVTRSEMIGRIAALQSVINALVAEVARGHKVPASWPQGQRFSSLRTRLKLEKGEAAYAAPPELPPEDQAAVNREAARYFQEVADAILAALEAQAGRR